MNDKKKNIGMIMRGVEIVMFILSLCLFVVFPMLASAETVTGDIADIYISTEGVTVLTYYAADNEGNQEEPQSKELKLDKTSPAIEAFISPNPNSYGWSNTDAIVSFEATDGLSGIKTVTAPITVTAEGANQYIGGTAEDNAGNTASTYAEVSMDKTPPQITIQLNPIKLSEDKEHKKNKDKKDDDEEEDDDDKEPKGKWYELVYSSADNLSDIKTISAGLEIISVDGYKTQLKEHQHLKIKIDEDKLELKIEAPNPGQILTQLQTGLFNLNTGQILKLKLKHGHNKWKIKQKEKGIDIQAPSIIFKAEAEDYAGNRTEESVEFDGCMGDE